MKVLTRGIYSTALAKFLLDNGFVLTQPSKRIIERLKIEAIKEPWDVAIEARPWIYGITVYGTKEGVERIIESFQKLGKITINPSIIPIGSVYSGEVIEANYNTSIVNIGSHKVFLRGKKNVGERVIVSIIKPVYSGMPEATEGIAIAGKTIIISKNLTADVWGYVEPHVKENLLNFVKNITKSGWGILLLDLAQYVEPISILEEYNSLVREGNTLLEKSLSLTQKVGQIRDGIHIAKVNFSYDVKQTLDKIRSSVLPTVSGHHYMRSLGKDTQLLVDFAENLVTNGYNPEDIGAHMIKSFIMNRFSIGSLVKIRHYKPNGERIELTPGKVINIDAGNFEVSIRRQFSESEGIYDGIGAPKEKGDYAISTYKMGSMISRHTYYNRSGVMKGIYINISTPIEFTWDGIQYIDLLVDIVRNYADQVEIIDVNELKKYVESGYVSKSLAEEVLKIAKEQAELLKIK
ncbi:MAG: DUF402 domain-containing protein [Thermoprotei archaeon]